MSIQQQNRADRSLGELVSELSSETSTLVRQEVTLARMEISQKVNQAARDLVYVAAGGAVAYAGLLGLVAAVILGLWRAGLPLWGSALLVGAVVAAIGGGLVMKAMNDFRRNTLAPQHTMESLKEDVQWAREQTR